MPAPPSLNVGRGGFGAGGKSESGGSKDDDFTDEDEGDETDSGAGTLPYLTRAKLLVF